MWDLYAPFVEQALNRSEGDWTAEEVRLEVAHNRAQLWPGEKSVAVSQVYMDKDRLGMRVWLASGDMSELMEMLEAGEKWAKAKNLDFVSVDGRRGWSRVLRKKGYKENDGLLVKEI